MWCRTAEVLAAWNLDLALGGALSLLTSCGKLGNTRASVFLTVSDEYYSLDLLADNHPPHHCLQGLMGELLHPRQRVKRFYFLNLVF